MFSEKTIRNFIALVLFSTTIPCSGAARSESNDTYSEHENLISEFVQLSPVTGFTVLASTAIFNIGAATAFRLLSTEALYFEPSIIVGLSSRAAQFSLDPGFRYDINLADTNVRPFFHLAMGPTLQTSGTTAVFNASVGPGVLIPLSRQMDIRAEANFVNIDGNAGFQLLGGITL